MQENIVQCFNRVPGFFIGIEQPNVLLRTIEVKTGYRFPVVVIQKNTEIALGISGDDALGINLRAYNRFNYVVAFRFFFSRNNQAPFRHLLIVQFPAQEGRHWRA